MPLRPRVDQVAKLVDVALTEGAMTAARAGKPFSLSAFRLVSQVRHRFGVPATVLDVGANKGQFSRAAATAFPGARIIAFEPLESVAAEWRRQATVAGVHLPPQLIHNADNKLLRIRRLGPALVAAVMVMAAPLWLIGGFVLDLLRKLPAGLRRAWFALLRALGFLVVLPLTPFIFVWAFLVELFRPNHRPAAPVQSAAKRTAEVINFATARKARRPGPPG